MTQSFTGRRIVATAALALASVLSIGGASTARAQVTQQDPRWQAWLGCWTPVGDPSRTQICVLPAAGNSAIDIATVVGGKTVSRERVEADGERHASSKDECNGVETARWSSNGQRVYLRADYECPGNALRKASTLIAMSAAGEWLSVQDVRAGGNNAVRVIRYRPSIDTTALPQDVKAALPRVSLGANTARIAAGAPLSTADVIDASQQLDVAVVEAWLSDRGQDFGINGQQLMRLADAGVPAPITDLLVALSYPKQFVVNAPSDQSQMSAGGAMGGGVGAADDSVGRRGIAGAGCDPYRYYSPFSYSPYGWDYGCPSFGYSYYGAFSSPYAFYSPYGFGYGYGSGFGGWYAGGQPVVVLAGAASSPASHGRVVNGRGYSQAGSGGTGTASGSSGGGSAAAASGGGSAGGSSAGSSSAAGARTAVPKKP